MTQPSPITLPNPAWCLVFIDLTTDATPAAMRPAQAFQTIIDAIREGLIPFSAAHGQLPVAFRIASSPSDRAPNEVAVNFRDTIPEAPGALAYHTVTNGVPDIEIGVDLFQTLTDGSNGQESMSGGVDHEVKEMLRDPGGNGWKDNQDGSGRTRAEEVSDIVQNTGYPASNGAWLSNFVLESYFIPGAPGPWDYLGVMTSQSDKSNGYEIHATAPTDVSTDDTKGLGLVAPTKLLGENLHQGRKVYVAEGSTELTELQRRRKAHPYSRTYRRGVRL